MTQTNSQIREEYWKKFPDPMEEKYGTGFALYCSNCSKKYGVEEKIDWWLAKLDLAIKEERKRITGIIRQVGALENDEEVEKLIDIINNC